LKGVSMQKKVSKSKFKAQLLEYLREVEESGNDIIVTNFGKPTIKI
jgi:prevent-host-death family protein